MTLPAITPNMSLYNDPYFMMAYNSPNMYGAWANQMGYMGIPAISAAAAQPTIQVQQQTQTPNASKNKKGKVLAGLIGTGLTATAIIVGLKKGPAGEKNILKRIWKGLVSATESGKDKLMPKMPAVTEIDGKTVVKIPGIKNVIKNTEELEKIGEKQLGINTISDIVNKDTNRLQKGYSLSWFGKEIKIGDTEPAYSLVCGFSNNGTSKYVIKDINGNIVKRNGNNKALFEEANAIVGKVKNGKIDLNELDRVGIKHTNPETGLLTRVQYAKPEGSNELQGKFQFAVSDTLPLDHYRVDAYRSRHEGFDKFITKYLNGEAEKKVVNAKYDTEVGTLYVKGNGNVMGIRTNDNYWKADSEMYDSIKQRNQDIFNDVLKNKDQWYDVWLQAA